MPFHTEDVSELAGCYLEVSYQYIDGPSGSRINVYYGKTDNFDKAYSHINSMMAGLSEHHAKYLAESTAEEPDSSIEWSEEKTTLFGKPAVHYAFEAKTTPENGDDTIFHGYSTSFWSEGQDFKYVCINSISPDEDFRDDILNPVLNAIESIDNQEESSTVSDDNESDIDEEDEITVEEDKQDTPDNTGQTVIKYDPDETLAYVAKPAPVDVSIENDIGPTNDFPEFFRIAYDYWIDHGEEDGIECQLYLSSPGSSSECNVSDEFTLSLTIVNCRSTAVPVLATVFPQNVEDKIEEISCSTSVQKARPAWNEWYDPAQHNFITDLLTLPGRKIIELFDSVDSWVWKNHTAPIQLYYGGGAYILEPGQVLVFSYKYKAKAEGDIAFTAEIHFPSSEQKVETFYYGEMALPFALGVKAQEVDSDDFKYHVKLEQDITIVEAKSFLGGLFWR